LIVKSARVVFLCYSMSEPLMFTGLAHSVGFLESDHPGNLPLLRIVDLNERLRISIQRPTNAEE
jgi:hypothetical protein